MALWSDKALSSTVSRERQLASRRTMTQSITWPRLCVGMSMSWTRLWSFNKVFNWSTSPLDESSKWKLKSPINARSLRAWLYTETNVGNSSKNILFGRLFCLLGGGRYKRITETDVLSWDNRSSTDSNGLNGRGCLEMESDRADMVAMPPPLRPMRGNEWKR